MVHCSFLEHPYSTLAACSAERSRILSVVSQPGQVMCQPRFVTGWGQQARLTIEDDLWDATDGRSYTGEARHMTSIRVTGMPSLMLVRKASTAGRSRDIGEQTQE